VIEGVEIVIDNSKWVHVFLAGTKAEKGRLLTAGGRVLVVVGLGHSYKHAKNAANAALDMIKFEGEYHRTDIADEVIYQG
jgi:phosphoribosylamine-glycine ligase